jgi:hypothetical protein
MLNAGQGAASTAVKWVAHLLKYKRVIDRVFLMDRFLYRALIGFGFTFDATGFDRRALQPNNLYDAIVPQLYLSPSPSSCCPRL